MNRRRFYVTEETRQLLDSFLKNLEEHTVSCTKAEDLMIGDFHLVPNLVRAQKKLIRFIEQNLPPMKKASRGMREIKTRRKPKS